MFTVVPSTILDSLADGVFTIDAASKITFFNRAAEAITGIARDAAVGRVCSDVFRASVCQDTCPLRQTCETGEAIVDRPLYIRRSDGQRIPVSVSTAVLRDEQGAVVGGANVVGVVSAVGSSATACCSCAAPNPNA